MSDTIAAPAHTHAARSTAGFRVNPSLSRGLATRALRVLKLQGDAYRAGLSTLAPRTDTKKGVARTKREFVALGERTKLIQVIGSSPNEREITVCQFVPKVGATRIQAAPLAFTLHQYVINRNGVMPGPDCGPALLASDHAVERLFLRLNTLDLSAVVRELQDAMLLALPLWALALGLRLRQVPLPTTSGAFLCHVDAAQSHLLAKTWVPYSGMSARWSRAVAAINEAVLDAGGYSALAVTLCAGVEASLEADEGELFGAVGEALAGHEWLRDPYTPRVDAIAQAWKAYEASKRRSVA